MPNIGDSRPSDIPVVKPKSRQCYNADGLPKLSYSTKSSAKRAIKRHIGKRVDGTPFQRGAQAYRCSECNRYHIGHKKPQESL